MKIVKWSSAVLFGLLIGACLASYGRIFDPKPDLTKLKLPTGFSIQIFSQLSSQYGQPRMMTFDAQGNLYVALATTGQVVMLQDKNKDGIAETPTVVARNLNAPHSVTFVGDAMLVSNQDGIVKLTKTGTGWSEAKPFISITDCP